MSALTTLLPETDETTIDPDAVNHWMRKSDITRGIVEGVSAKALCGTVFTPLGHGGGRVSNKNQMMCPLCQLVFEEKFA